MLTYLFSSILGCLTIQQEGLGGKKEKKKEQ